MRKARVLLLICAVLATAAGSTTSSGSPADPRLEPGVLRAPGDVLIRFREGVPDHILAATTGLSVRYRFMSIPAVFAHATPAAIRALAARDDLVFVERDAPVEFDLNTATIASRAKEVWSGPDPVTVDGELVDGSGVGIAIVDTGVDGLHPDFEGRIAGSYQATPAGVVPVGPYSAFGGEHGTHVAGIAAGSGQFSSGKYRGVAPGAGLYSFQMYGALSYGAIAFDWILQNGAAQSPPIRVVNNSWHCSVTACAHPFNPNKLHYQLASALASNGVVVTWSAGNSSGDGDVVTTNPEAVNPTPGIIGVGNYKDDNTGRRDLCMSSSSAMGSSADPSTWPDLIAPGRSITSTWAFGPTIESSSGLPIGRNPVNGDDSYMELTGTSMAAPHVAGIVALMLEANPALTPAEMEYILKQTATELVGPSTIYGCGIDYVRADASHPWNGANYAAGHGLVDARAAVDLAIGFDGIPPRIDPEPIPDGFIVSRLGLRADHTFYLQGENGLTTSYPDAPAPRVRVLDGQARIVHTSAPFTAPLTIDAVSTDMYIGSTGEAGDILSYIGRSSYVTTVERVEPDGTASLLAEKSTPNTSARTLAPIHRDFKTFLATPVTLNAGDRVRVVVSLIVFPYQGVSPGVNSVWDLYSESTTPSRIAFGTTVRRPVDGSREACERRKECAMVDAAHPYEGLICGDDVTFRIRWQGPVGSSLILNCDGLVFTCPITVEGETCERELPISPATVDPGAYCTYRLPDGTRGGSGVCESLAPLPG